MIRRILLALTMSASVYSIAGAQSVPAPQAAPSTDGESLVGREPTGPARPTPRLPDGRPDLTGYWKGIKEPGKPTGNIGRDEPGFKLPFTAAGKAALDYNLTRTIDPEALCILGGIPRHNGSGLPFEILHTPQRLAFLYLYNTHRIIPADGRNHHPDPEPRYFGNPVARWDGDTLVIDSIGFKDNKDGKLWADENANPQSAQTHVIERWSRPDRDHIHLEETVIDPVYYTRPLHFARTWVLAPDPEDGPVEYACNENNIDAAHLGPGPGAIGPDGNRGYGGPKLPDTPPGPEAYGF